MKEEQLLLDYQLRKDIRRSKTLQEFHTLPIIGLFNTGRLQKHRTDRSTDEIGGLVRVFIIAIRNQSDPSISFATEHSKAFRC